MVGPEMSMKIKVADLPADGLELALNIFPETAKPLLVAVSGETIPLDGPVTGRLLAEPSGERVVVSGRIAATVLTSCARCLEEFPLPVAEDILVVFTPRSEDLVEAEAEDLDGSEEFYTGEHIDLWPVMAEHLLLALPIKALCSENCRGLCPKCGRNLNVEPCKCQPDRFNPLQAALKNLVDK